MFLSFSLLFFFLEKRKIQAHTPNHTLIRTFLRISAKLQPKIKSDVRLHKAKENNNNNKNKTEKNKKKEKALRKVATSLENKIYKDIWGKDHEL